MKRRKKKTSFSSHDPDLYKLSDFIDKTIWKHWYINMSHNTFSLILNSAITILLNHIKEKYSYLVHKISIYLR